MERLSTKRLGLRIAGSLLMVMVVGVALLTDWYTEQRLWALRPLPGEQLQMVAAAGGDGQRSPGLMRFCGAAPHAGCITFDPAIWRYDAQEFVNPAGESQRMLFLALATSPDVKVVMKPHAYRAGPACTPAYIAAVDPMGEGVPYKVVKEIVPREEMWRGKVMRAFFDVSLFALPDDQAKDMRVGPAACRPLPAQGSHQEGAVVLSGSKGGGFSSEAAARAWLDGAQAGEVVKALRTLAKR